MIRDHDRPPFATFFFGTSSNCNVPQHVMKNEGSFMNLADVANGKKQILLTKDVIRHVVGDETLRNWINSLELLHSKPENMQE